MKILLFEWLCGGGLWLDQIAPDGNCSMQRQGKEMLSAVLQDFLKAGVDVVMPIDGRILDQFPDLASLTKHPVWATDKLDEVLPAIAKSVDAILVIAPETESTLANCLRWLKPFNEKLIGPDLNFVTLTSDKLETCRFLKRKGFNRHANGVSYSTYLELDEPKKSNPLVFKPVDGAGSEGTWASGDLDLEAKLSGVDAQKYMVEHLISGTPMSVSVLCGSGRSPDGCKDGFECLPPTIQLFDREPVGHYIGARFPVDAELARRATNLATEVMTLLPSTRGYVGLDMVIGDDTDPASDCFIEVNPRLTMSYVKLREVVDGNLAMRMLELLGNAE